MAWSFGDYQLRLVNGSLLGDLAAHAAVALGFSPARDAWARFSWHKPGTGATQL